MEQEYMCPILSAAGEDVPCKGNRCAWFDMDFWDGACSVFSATVKQQELLKLIDSQL